MGYLFILGYVALVGVATFLMKVGLKNLSPYQLHFLMGVGMFLTGVPALIIAHRTFKMPVKDLPLGILIGIMMAGGSLLFTLAFNKMPASTATVLATLYVVVVILLSWVFLKEGFDWVKVSGLALTFIGTAILSLRA